MGAARRAVRLALGSSGLSQMARRVARRFDSATAESGGSKAHERALRAVQSLEGAS